MEKGNDVIEIGRFKVVQSYAVQQTIYYANIGQGTRDGCIKAGSIRGISLRRKEGTFGMNSPIIQYISREYFMIILLCAGIDLEDAFEFWQFDIVTKTAQQS